MVAGLLTAECGAKVGRVGLVQVATPADQTAGLKPKRPRAEGGAVVGREVRALAVGGAAAETAAGVGREVRPFLGVLGRVGGGLVGGLLPNARRGRSPSDAGLTFVGGGPAV